MQWLLVSSLIFAASSLFGAELSLAVIDPPDGSVVLYQSLTPAAKVTSDFELKTVTVRLGSQELPLTYIADPHVQLWSTVRAVDLTALPSGTNEIVFTAIDIFGNSVEQRNQFILDRPPVLHVTTPTDAIARPLVDISADCEDDLGGCTIQVLDPENHFLFTGAGSVEGTLDLSAFEGSIRTIRIFASDARGHVVVENRNIVSLSNPRFREVDRLPGPLLALSTNALLFSVRDGTNLFLNVKDRTTGRTQIVATNFDSYPAPVLTDTGVIYAVNRDGRRRFIDYNRGASLDLGTEYTIFIANGRFAVLGKEPTPGQFPVLRDLEAKTNIVIPLEAQVLNVAENGTAVVGAGKLYQFRDGQVRAIPSDAPPVGISPRTDGTNTVWFSVSGGGDDPAGSIWAETPGGVTQLSQGLSSYAIFYRANNFNVPPYLIANVWIAFNRPGGQGQEQVWVRSPDGNEKQLTFFAQKSYLMALRQDGAVVTALAPGASIAPPGDIYFIRPGNPPQLLSGNVATFSFAGAELYAHTGSTLFTVQTEGLPMGITSASREAGVFSFYVTGTAPSSFDVETSTNLLLWSSLSSHSVSNTLPLRLEFSLPPQRLDSKIRAYRLRAH